ncbi:MAG: hypothetical protein J5I93_18215 [Pirellulaceae bacterium]|nr:hypothetical protein [Pirellulaceae bacterium]
MERYRIVPDGYIYFVTYTIVDWLPVFLSEAVCRIVTNSLNYCHDNKQLRINAYVIMPTHLHAIVLDAAWNSQRLEATLNDFRRFTGRSICDFVDQRFPMAFRRAFRDAAGRDRRRRCWRDDRHPVVIESEWFWEQKVRYIHENPCRKGLVLRPEFWRFSSAAYWLSDGSIPNDVKLTALEW